MGWLTEDPEAWQALLTAGAMGVACAVLSVVVVLRHWAFIGEGISHAGFGGIGTAWLLSMAWPALASEGAVYAVAVLFCVGTAVAIGFITRRNRVNSDAAIGIFLVASLAWGVLALAIFRDATGKGGADWERYLLGDIRLVSARSAVGAACLAAAAILTVWALRKEIIAYVYDPLLAQVSGVRAGLIHYLLMVLLAMVIVIGMGLAGALLVPALLILPGVTALLLSRRLGVVVGVSVAVSLGAAIAGVAINLRWPMLPAGPAIVLVLFVVFLGAYVVGRAEGRGR